MGLEFLLSQWARHGSTEALDMVGRTFRAMSQGGIYDQVGGGLHRYSVDARWLVPHFEKMLYDNALYVRLGVHLWQATGDAEVRRVTEQTIEWLEREMTSPEGGFYSSLDADSEGHEGRFYVWEAKEIDDAMGADADLVRAAWGVSSEGNFEGRNILHVPVDLRIIAARSGRDVGDVESTLQRARTILYARRAGRVWPGRDDKTLAAWNGLMLRALAEAARAFDSPRAYALALGNGAFVRDHLVREDRVLRSARLGRSQPVGFLDDHAAVAIAFIELAALTSDLAWLDLARRITTRIVSEFLDPATGLLFDTSRDHEPLITRPRDVTDNALPAGSSLAAELLFKLAVLDDRTDYAGHTRRLVAGLREAMMRYPSGFGHLLGVADVLVHGAVEVAIVGDEPAGRASLVHSLGAEFVPGLVWLAVAPADADRTVLTRSKDSDPEWATAYVCRQYQCDAPTRSPGELRRQLVSARRAG
jgi:uncharacterized protein YyaL (SSP411 family)